MGEHAPKGFRAEKTVSKLLGKKTRSFKYSPVRGDRAQSHRKRVQSLDVVAHFLLVKVPLSQHMDRVDCPTPPGMSENGDGCGRTWLLWDWFQDDLPICNPVLPSRLHEQHSSASSLQKHLCISPSHSLNCKRIGEVWATGRITPWKGLAKH